MNVRVTDRDLRILVKCGICRWLSTAQIQRLYFPKASPNAVQKRLRKLADDGYLRAYRENPMAEVLHSVGPKGRPLVEETGIEVASGTAPPKQEDHLLGINTVRIALETNNVPLVYFFAAWHLAVIGWSFPVIPDAIFAISGSQRQRFLLEYDRNTEPSKVILAKLRAYAQGIPDFRFDAVLLVTEEERRLEQLGREIRREGICTTCLATNLSEVERAPLDAVFIDLSDGTRRPMLSSR